MNAQQLKNSILQDIYSPKDGWVSKELKDIVADSCPISYGIVQQGNHIEGGVPVVRPVDLHCNYVRRIGLKCTTKSISDSYSRTLLRGDEILLCVRGTTGIMSLASEEIKGCNVNRGVVPLYFKKEYDRLFVYYQMQTPFIQDIISEKTTGSALKQLNIKDLRAIRLVFPPFAEQKRIVAKIEELLPKVEEYGKAQDALDKLNAELPERLKKSILQEAISGRLVPQDPNDEPASILLDKIRAEKAKLVKEGKLKKKDLIETPIQEDEIPFDIPDSWVWVKFGDLVTTTMGKTPPRGDISYWGNNDYPWVSISDMKQGGIIYGTKEYISQKAANDCFHNEISKCGTLIMSFKLTVGRTSILGIDAYHNEAIISIQTYSDIDYYTRDYLSHILPVVTTWGDSKDAIKGKTLNAKSIHNLLIPLPPLAEQHRIVEKLEQLLGEIDKLEK